MSEAKEETELGNRDEKFLLETPDLEKATLRWAGAIGIIAAVVIYLVSGDAGQVVLPDQHLSIPAVVFYTGWGGLLAALFGGLLALLTLMSRTRTVYGHTIVFDGDGNLKYEVKADQVFWARRWLAYCEGCVVEKYQDKYIDGAITLGNIDCWVRARPYMTPEGFAAQRKRFEVSSTASVRYAAQQKLRDYLLELHKHWGGRQTFDNPKDQNQQAEFREYVLDCLQPLAYEDGITIEGAHFTR